MITCPKCERVLMEMGENGIPKLRTRIILFEASGAVSVCPGCKEHVPVPIAIITGEQAPAVSPANSKLKHFILTK